MPSEMTSDCYVFRIRKFCARQAGINLNSSDAHTVIVAS